MQKINNKLKLNKQSLRVLTESSLRSVAGGLPPTKPQTSWCPSAAEVCPVTTIWETLGCP